MRKNNRLVLAWCVFGVVVIIFLVITKIYYDISKDRQVSNHQYRILINKNIVCGAAPEENSQEEPKPPLPAPEQKLPAKDDESCFYENTKYGDLPRISPDGDRIFDVYSAKFTETNKKKACLVVYVDNSSVGFLPHAIRTLGNTKVTFIVPNHLDRIVESVKSIFDAGHEIFMQIPTQFSSTGRRENDISPFLANTNPENTIDKLRYLLAVSRYIIGIANTTQTLLTKSKNDMSVILDELSRRGLAFLDIEKTNDILQVLARDDGVIRANASAVFDSKSVVEISDDNDGKIFFIHLDKLHDFLDAMAKYSDYVVVPISSLIRKKMR